MVINRKKNIISFIIRVEVRKKWGGADARSGWLKRVEIVLITPNDFSG